MTDVPFAAVSGVQVLRLDDDPAMGFNRRKMEADRKAKADAEAAARRAAEPQVLADAERLICAWNERQARRMPLLFAPTIGAALVIFLQLS